MQTLSRLRVTLMVAPLLACHNIHPQREPEGSGISAPEPTAGAPKSQAAPAHEAAGGALSVGPSDTGKVIPQPDSQIEIAGLGEYLPYDDAAPDERSTMWWRTRVQADWHALCARPGGVELVPTRMQVAPARVRDDEGGLIVSASSCPGAIALIRGLPGAGRVVQTAKVTHKGAPSASAQDRGWELALPGKSWRLYFQDAFGLPLMINDGAQAHELLDWKEAAARYGEPSSSRHDWGFASNVEVLWAGDLNGDGQLDLLLKEGDGEIGRSLAFFLSSKNGEPQLVDRFHYGGC